MADVGVTAMKRLVPIPTESAELLKKEKPTELGYQFVSVKLKDGRFFEQAVASEGCIIQVKGHKDIPFTEAEVESVEVNDKEWNFRRQSDAKRPKQ
jgi:hypothetical protein